MNRGGQQDHAWIGGLVYIAGMIFLSIFIIASQSYLQHHWQVLMDSIMLFLSQKEATQADITFLYLLELAFASAILVAYEATHRYSGWRLVVGATILLMPLLAVIPLGITFLVVWPAIVADRLLRLLMLEVNLGTGFSKFLAIVTVHAVIVLLWFKFGLWRASRESLSR